MYPYPLPWPGTLARIPRSYHPSLFPVHYSLSRRLQRELCPGPLPYASSGASIPVNFEHTHATHHRLHTTTQAWAILTGEITMETNQTKPRVGQLARIYTKKVLPLRVLKSAAGYYIGTADDEGPVSRESLEYFSTESRAQNALDSGEFTQRTDT